MILRAAAGTVAQGMRLDEGVRALFPRFSRERIRKAIDRGGVRVGDAVVRVASRRLLAADVVTLALSDEPFRELSLGPDDLLYEDDEYLAVNKPAGFYSQRTPYQLKGTVEFAVTRLLKERGIAEPARVIHRLDKGTSGVMIFPKTQRAAGHVSKELEAGRAEKVYWAVVQGRPERGEWIVEAPIADLGKSRFAVRADGREARTAFRLLDAGTGAGTGTAASLVEARPRTGRTHQIRLHLAHAGMPVVGDDRYGGVPAPRMMLHCRRMAFRAADGREVAAEADPGRAFREACRWYGISPEPEPGGGRTPPGE